ncbi:EEF1A lysine methyltransferase 1 [Pelobates fuscus]|uniref:EEF1A lysine methyltransferase 1 n=1 Tax=Pelobates fuscus TaxID=191477 RepID=UPI002FE45987
MDSIDDDDDVPQLSSHALATLQEFYAEQAEQNTEHLEPDYKFSVGAVEEDWQLSQFWYSDETALNLAKELIQACGENGRIACVSTPSIYQKLKGLSAENISVCLLEYDRRFSVYGDDYVFYDYNDPLNLPESMEKHSFDLVIADPPYLSEECLRKTAETIKFLARSKVLLCTGAVMEDLAATILGLKICKFIPKHTSSLANEFRCYSNYPLGLDIHI